MHAVSYASLFCGHGPPATATGGLFLPFSFSFLSVLFYYYFLFGPIPYPPPLITFPRRRGGSNTKPSSYIPPSPLLAWALMRRRLSLVAVCTTRVPFPDLFTIYLFFSISSPTNDRPSLPRVCCPPCPSPCPGLRYPWRPSSRVDAPALCHASVDFVLLPSTVHYGRMGERVAVHELQTCRWPVCVCAGVCVRACSRMTSGTVVCTMVASTRTRQQRSGSHANTHTHTHSQSQCLLGLPQQTPCPML